MPVKLKDENLLKEQLKAIDNLQEKIKLLKFDISKNLETISYFKEKMERKNQKIAKAREELEMMKKENNYKNINDTLRLLREINYEE